MSRQSLLRIMPDKKGNGCRKKISMAVGGCGVGFFCEAEKIGL